MQEEGTGEVWETLSYEEKNEILYHRQRDMLRMFLERRAITPAQYEKSYGDLQKNWERKKGA